MSHLVILTGERAVGKTTVCRETVALAQQRGLACRGILTLDHQGARDVVDVSSGHQRRLTKALADGQSVLQGRFCFDPRTLSWGAGVLSRELSCDLLVIDEVGPLEVVHREGWVIAFDCLEAGEYELAILVVRPELLAQVRDRLGSLSTDVFTVTQDNRDRLPLDLVEMVGREA